MMKATLLKPPLPYLWEFLVSKDKAVPMAEARKFLNKQFDCIRPTTKVRIYVRIEKE